MIKIYQLIICIIFMWSGLHSQDTMYWSNENGDIIDTTIYLNDWGNQEIPPTTFYNIIDTIKVVQVRNLIDLVNVYKEYCYNDSTDKSGWVYVDLRTDKTRGWPWETKTYKEVWVHREPTFGGFIEWLEKR